MADRPSIFIPDGVDPFDASAARRAAIDCVNAVEQLLQTARHQRCGAQVTENAILRCLYDLDRAIEAASNYHACHRPYPSLPSAPCAAAAKLASKVRTQYRKAVVEWKSRSDAPSDGWTCLWECYAQRFGNPVGPTFSDAVDCEEKIDSDEQGLLNTARLFIPEVSQNHQWHTGIWPYICVRLQQFDSVDLIALVDSLMDSMDSECPLRGGSSKSKKNATSGDARATLIAALTKHHEYANGGCLNLEPIGSNELARLAHVSNSTASVFFNKEFNGGDKGGLAMYRAICRNAGRLADSLKALNGEFAPHDLFGRRPAGEDDRDERDE